MPTVLRSNGFKLVIYTHDHQPPHVHVIGNDGDAVFNLNCPDGPPELRELYIRQRKANLIRQILIDHLPELCRKWSEIHDDHGTRT